MRNLRRVVWSEGMFLTPQHLQAHDRYLEDSIQFRLLASHFANWGITRIKIDTDTLARGIFKLEQCSGILPDGLAFDIPEGTHPPSSSSFTKEFSAGQFMDVYLAVHERQEEGKNVFLTERQEDPSPHIDRSEQENLSQVDGSRYVTRRLPVLDENHGLEGTAAIETNRIQFAEPKFRLLFGNQKQDDYTVLRVAQITQDPTGKYILNDKYVAPCLDISCSEYLLNLLNSRIGALAGRASSLGERRGKRGIGLAGFSATEDFWLMHTINTYLPPLRHIWAVRRSHPEALFFTMLHLAGALSTFSIDADMSPLQKEVNPWPKYDHTDLSRCFTDLDTRIKEFMIEPEPPYVRISLEKNKLVWSGTIKKEEHFNNSQFFLSLLVPKMEDYDAISKVQKLVKISSQKEIEKGIGYSLSGLKLVHVPTPPQVLPVRQHKHFFRLTPEGEHWQAIRNTKTVSIFAPTEIVEPEIELSVVFT